MRGTCAVTVLVITLTLSLGSSRAGARKRRNDILCPVKCFVDQEQFGMMRDVDGSITPELNPGNCDEVCGPSQHCLRKQDPENTQFIYSICAEQSALCDYNENSDCQFHVFEQGGSVKLLPWPYDTGSSKSEPAEEVCTDDQQQCNEGRKCYGNKMRDGSVNYSCADSAPDCDVDSGCESLCLAESEICEPETNSTETNSSETNSTASTEQTSEGYATFHLTTIHLTILIKLILTITLI